MANRRLPCQIEQVVQNIGAPSYCAERPAAGTVRRQGERRSFLPIVQLGECVFEQWQHARLIDQIIAHGVGQARFERQADALCRAADHLLQLVGIQWQHNFGVLLQQIAKRGVLQRAIVIIGAEGHDQHERTVRFTDGDHQTLEQMGARCFIVHQRKHFLELIDHQHKAIRLTCWHDTLDRPQ